MEHAAAPAYADSLWLASTEISAEVMPVFHTVPTVMLVVDAFATESVPTDAVCAKRFVDDAVVLNKVVVVAFASVVAPFKYAAPETVSAVEDAYVALKLVAQPVVMVSRVEEAFANVWRPVQLFALAMFRLSALVPPSEMGELPTVIEPDEVRPMVEFAS